MFYTETARLWVSTICGHLSEIVGVHDLFCGCPRFVDDLFFSIADCMSAWIAFCFEAYGAELSSDANTYMQTLLDNPFVQKWINLGRREQEPLSIAYASNA